MLGINTTFVFSLLAILLECFGMSMPIALSFVHTPALIPLLYVSNKHISALPVTRTLAAVETAVTRRDHNDPTPQRISSSSVMDGLEGERAGNALPFGPGGRGKGAYRDLKTPSGGIAPGMLATDSFIFILRVSDTIKYAVTCHKKCG